MPKRTLKRNTTPRKRKLGFRKKSNTRSGKKILKRRRAKGRARLAL